MKFFGAGSCLPGIVFGDRSLSDEQIYKVLGLLLSVEDTLYFPSFLNIEPNWLCCCLSLFPRWCRFWVWVSLPHGLPAGLLSLRVANAFHKPEINRYTNKFSTCHTTSTNLTRYHSSVSVKRSRPRVMFMTKAHTLSWEHLRLGLVCFVKSPVVSSILS